MIAAYEAVKRRGTKEENVIDKVVKLTGEDAEDIKAVLNNEYDWSRPS